MPKYRAFPRYSQEELKRVVFCLRVRGASQDILSKTRIFKRAHTSLAFEEETMNRAGAGQALLAAQESLLSVGGEQLTLREDILSLAREEEREMSDVLPIRGASTAKREGRGGRQGVTTCDSAAYAVNVKGTSTRALRRKYRQCDAVIASSQEVRETRGINNRECGAFQARHFQEVPPARVDESIAADIRRVEVVGRAVTSISLASAVETTLDGPTVFTSPSGLANDEAGRQDSQRAPALWALSIRQCQLPSLIPVAGLLHNLDGLIALGIHEVDGLALAGVERVLADARCLSTLTIRRCRLSQLPRLQSGSIEVLDLGENDIESTSGLETLFRLKELNLEGNNLSTLAELRPLVPPGAGSLRELNLNNNPLQTIPRYATFQHVWCPRCIWS